MSDIKKRIFIISDSHFHHNNLVQYCGRPEDFTERIKTAWKRDVQDSDTVIHCGDIGMKGFGQDVRDLPGTKILCKGNHDKATNTWYLEHGFDLVVETLLMNIYGKRILFSHKPQKDLGYFDLNCFGHIHTASMEHLQKFDPESFAVITPNKHKAFVLENLEYRPILLETLLKKVFKII